MACITNVLAIVAAIFVVEGGERANPPYGIMPLKEKWSHADVATKPAVMAECKRWCENTVRNNIKRWQDSGHKECYLDFLADKYCPPNVDPKGNANWKRNIRAVLLRDHHLRCVH